MALCDRKSKEIGLDIVAPFIGLEKKEHTVAGRRTTGRIATATGRGTISQPPRFLYLWNLNY